LGLGMHILGLGATENFLGFMDLCSSCSYERILYWFHDLDQFWYNSLHRQLYEVWLINNQGLICINNHDFFSFNPRVLFLHQNLFWSNRDYWLIIVNVWCLIIFQWLISNMPMSLVCLYLVWILIYVVRHVLYVLEFF
jgi:hypothetical protein